jgi:inositol-pentakisphosphate 2-kinase
MGPNQNSYCIEIKPKEGYLSPTFMEYLQCYYCMKQMLKLRGKQIKSISQYCPLDLFSGDKKTMKRALWSLINNPQNNFKLFKNSDLVYSDKSSLQDFHEVLSEILPFKKSANLFLDFIIETLINNNSNEFILMETDPCANVNKDCCVEMNNLPENSFLHNLLSVQKLWENVKINTDHIDVNGGTDYVSSLIDSIKDLDSHTKLSANFLTEVDDKHLALMSAVAKDCSIMISFSLKPVEGYPTMVIGEHRMSYRVAVTDLEPKPEGTLLKRLNTEAKLIALYKEYLDSRNKCKYLI